MIEPPRDDDNSDAVETAIPESTETEVDDVEPASQASEDADESQRTYH